jgi:diaminopimelate decarboxylase
MAEGARLRATDPGDGLGAPDHAPGPPWPASVRIGPAGLRVAGVSAAELAATHGTPLLLYDEDEIRTRCRAVRERFPRSLYAVKAFTAQSVVRLMLDEGFDLLASTGGEVEACLRAGASPSRIVLHGNNKSDDELELAVVQRLSLVIVDHGDELQRLDAIARTREVVQPILLRVVPEVEVETHESIATGHDASKFGTTLQGAPDVVRRAVALPGVRFDGLHAHIGSQVLDAAPYLRSIDALVTLATSAVPRSVRSTSAGGSASGTRTRTRRLPIGSAVRSSTTSPRGARGPASTPPCSSPNRAGPSSRTPA